METPKTKEERLRDRAHEIIDRARQVLSPMQRLEWYAATYGYLMDKMDSKALTWFESQIEFIKERDSK